jgi:dienelactone hydrolase
MPRSSIVLTLIVVLLLCQPARAAGPEGAWFGRCRLDGKDTFLLLNLQRKAGRTTGMAFSRPLGVRTPVSDVEAGENQLAFSFRTPDGTVRLSLALREDRLEGSAEYRGAKGDCAFRRRQPLDAATLDAFRGTYQLARDRVVLIGHYPTANYLFLADGDLRVEIFPVGPREFLSTDLRTIQFEQGAMTVSQSGQKPQRATRVQLYTEEEVEFASGDVRLAGTLTLPRGPGPHPALVFVHGSGPQRRGAEIVEAARFAQHGIASLAFDKRGTGESTGDWRQSDFDDLAGDVLAGVQLLRRDRRIRADKVGLWGVSQAGWVMVVAAARSPDVAFLIPISGGAVTPAEQEIWRHHQNLTFLGVPQRFRELERKAAAVAFDWQRRHQVGSLPLPNPFTDDNLNMFHDAPAVLSRVRQPVLAIFGGMDTLTPPRECAAICADVLRQRGDDDYSVRLFPRGSHGLFDGGKTGSPLELLRELRWVPGYFDTTVKWIHHHVDGPAFAQARQVDVDPDTIPVESRGLHQVSWYGSGAVQPWLLLVFLVVFASAALAAPAAWLWRRVRRAGPVEPGSWRTQWLAALLGLVNVGVLIAMIYVLYQLVQAVPHPLFARLSLVWNTLVAATWLSLLLVVLVGHGCIRAWRHGWWSRTGRVYYTLLALVGLGWVPFVFYWDLLRPEW